MRSFLLASAVALLFAASGCGEEAQGTHYDDNEEDGGTAIDPGGKPGKTTRPGLHDAGSEDAGTVDGATHTQPDASGGDGDGTASDSGTPKEVFQGTFKVTTHYNPKNTTCQPLDEVTTVAITKATTFEYAVATAKETRFVKSATWLFVNASTLDNDGQEVTFTTSGFSYAVNLGYSIGQQGPSGLCSTSSFTVTGIRQ